MRTIFRYPRHIFQSFHPAYVSPPPELPSRLLRATGMCCPLLGDAHSSSYCNFSITALGLHPVPFHSSPCPHSYRRLYHLPSTTKQKQKKHSPPGPIPRNAQPPFHVTPCPHSTRHISPQSAISIRPLTADCVMLCQALGTGLQVSFGHAAIWLRLAQGLYT